MHCSYRGSAVLVNLFPRRPYEQSEQTRTIRAPKTHTHMASSFPAIYERFMRRDLSYLLEQRGYLSEYRQQKGIRLATGDPALSADMRSALEAAIASKVDQCEQPSPRSAAPPRAPAAARQASEEFDIEVHKCGGKGQVMHVRVPKAKRAREEGENGE